MPWIWCGLMLIAATAAFAQSAESGDRERPLVELFTSEGCSSCPTADAWLVRQAAAVDRGDFSAVSWHVDYWNSLGWIDPFSLPEASLRQQRLAAPNGLVYTPGVFLDGREWRAWRTHAPFSRAQKAPRVRLDVTRSNHGLSARVATSDLTGSAQAQVLLVQRAVQSRVRRGENAGRTLSHDFVVRELRTLEGDSGTVQFSKHPPGKFGVVAFLEDRKGQVLQSVMVPVID